MSVADLREAAELIREGAPLSMAARRALADWLDQAAHRLEKGHHTGSRHSHRIARLVIDEVKAASE